MKQVIYKYAVPVDDPPIKLTLPLFSRILCVQVQKTTNTPQIWVLQPDPHYNPDLNTTIRTLQWFGTGQPIEGKAFGHIGTIQMQEGALVFHLFEVI